MSESGDAAPEVEVPLDYNPRDQENPEIPTLEEAAEKGGAGLKQLRTEMENMGLWMKDRDWMAEIDQVQRYQEKDSAIIGVVGSTGVGKSSLINAIVDEENVLATNCMRASTAVVTEIAYNHEKSPYKAQIEFIKREDWERELRILIKDLDSEETGEIRANPPTDSEAAVALEKIKAVYPWLEPGKIMTTPIQTLLDHPSVLKWLGSEVVIEEKKARTFASRVKSYVDSKGNRGPKGKKAKAQQIWPLIRVVKVFVKAKALETGAVLVDLPGVSDSNKARVAVAEDYMKQCSAHWVVAPITRAVDDKVAKDLLGKNFKMQMSMDSAFKNLTFICTKTDDICASEVQESLGLELPNPEQQEAKLAQLKAELKKIRDKREQLMDELNQCDDEIEHLEIKLSGQSIDLSVRPPAKRKQPEETALILAPSSEETQLSPLTTESPVDAEKTKPSATDELLSQYHDLKARRKSLQTQRPVINEEIKEKENEIAEFRQESLNTKKNNIWRCIEARNEYAKQEIRRDLARGIRELDDECLEEEGEEQRQDGEARTNRVAEESHKDIPVFCVSARAYQKLRNRFRKDSPLEGFTELDQTGILQLQHHCVKLTEEARQASAERFLSKLWGLLNSMALWSSSNNPENIQITDEKRQEVEAEFNKCYKEFAAVSFD